MDDATRSRIILEILLNVLKDAGIELPCKEYDPAGSGAGVEPDGYPQCAVCGHPRIIHADYQRPFPRTA